MKKLIDFLFVPSNDSHVQWMAPIARLLDNSKFMIIPSRDENSGFALEKLRIPYFEYSPDVLLKVTPKIIIMGNDWSPEELLILIQAKTNKIYSVCIQEGTLFYPDKVKRLTNADCLFALGKKTIEHFSHPNVIITGNPKFDQYSREPLPKNSKIMVNLNFTYGVEEENRDNWINGVLNALKSIGVEYFISAHPRQKTNNLIVDCPLIQSNAFTTKQQLGESTILISRFSTLIYEAVAAGRKVIYYNPHNEPYNLFHGGYKNIIYEAKSEEELKLIITTILFEPKIKNVDWDNFMKYHLGTTKKDASMRCAEALKNLDLANKQDNLDLLISQSHEIQFSLIKSNSWLAEQYDSLTKELKNLNSLIEEKDRWFDEVENAKDWLANQREELTNEVARLNDLLKEKDHWINEVQNAKDWLAKQREELINEVARLNDLLEKKNLWIGETENAKNWLKDQIELLTNEVKRLNSLLEQKEQWDLGVENAKDWLVEQNNELTFEVQNLQNNVKSKENNIKELKQEINRLQSLFYHLKSRFGEKNEN